MNPAEPCTQLTTQLISRGDYLAIEQGLLIIKPASRKTIPNEWLEKNEPILLSEMLNRIKGLTLKYQSFSTGNYTINNGKLTEGLTLMFNSYLDDKEYCAHFNVNTTRIRTTRGGKAGTPLPKNQFRATKGRAFYKFWGRTGTPYPRRAHSAFHDYMGHLRKPVFTGTLHPSIENRLVTDETLSPLEVSFDEIRSIFHKLPRTKYGQNTVNNQTTMPDKEITTPPMSIELNSNTTTGGNDYETSKQGKTDSYSNIPPREQTIEEWTDEYENTERV